MIEEEEKKLADLEFEYNIARLSNQEEEIIKEAKEKYNEQLNKVVKLSKINSKTQKTENNINTNETIKNAEDDV